MFNGWIYIIKNKINNKIYKNFLRNLFIIKKMIL